VSILALIVVAVPFAIGIYAYVIYPLALYVLSSFSRDDETITEQIVVPVSVVIPAYNEEKQIAGAIEAVLAQDYPADRLQVLVVSDASTDGTDQIVGTYAARGVELLRMAERRGKTRAENVACAQLRGEIVVNTDASVRLHRGAISKLVASMADPGVGVASSRDVSVSLLDQSANITEAGYVGYEMWVRRLETRTGGIVGASGSCYAIRAPLHMIPIRDDLSRDFAAALTARQHGFRAVSVDDAICFVPRTSALRQEYRRKVRTINRGMDTLYSRRELLGPTRYGVFAWKLISHKVLRWLLPISAIPALLATAFLARSQVWAGAALVGFLAVSGLAVAGALWPRTRPMPRLMSLAAFAFAANAAVVHAIWRLGSGHNDHVWEPTRRSG